MVNDIVAFLEDFAVRPLDGSPPPPAG
jgi:hypothetical protein